jgi:hypothetical protein
VFLNQLLARLEELSLRNVLNFLESLDNFKDRVVEERVCKAREELIRDSLLVFPTKDMIK